MTIKRTKLKTIPLILCLWFVSSCFSDEDRSFTGFTFSFSNRTNQSYDAELFIGGLQDGVFVATDSVPILNLRIGDSTVNGSYYIDENRWQPNLDAIRALPSEHAYFKLKLSEEREALIGRYQSSELFSLAIPPGKRFIDDEGRILISFDNSVIYGRAAEETN